VVVHSGLIGLGTGITTATSLTTASKENANKFETKKVTDSFGLSNIEFMFVILTRSAHKNEVSL
jgi:ribose 5-phosphate isomerase